MRIHFKLSPNKIIVPYNYQELILSKLHNWIGKNNEFHDNISLYSYNWLKGGEKSGDGLNFLNGCYWSFSAFDEKLISKISKKALIDNEFICGMKIKRIEIQNNPNFSEKTRFKIGSPILCTRPSVKNTKFPEYILYNEPIEFNQKITNTLIHKMDYAGISNECKDVKVYCDSNYKKSKTKLVTFKNIKNKASICPVIIEGHKDAIKFAWNVGIGNSTGCGFGFLL